MSKPFRNPRSAYSEDGSEIPPATVTSTRAHGMKTVSAFCPANGCGHHADLPLDGWPDETPIPGLTFSNRHKGLIVKLTADKG
jgi:hypothetical protein